MTMRVGVAVVALVVVAAGPVRADDTNYQNYLLGQRALGVGGAFTALAEDASAPFYNPGGATWIQGSSINTSVNVYGLERLKVERGFTAVLDSQPVSIDFNTSGLATLPTTLAFAKTFGAKMDDGGRKMAVGFSVFLRDESKSNIDDVLIGPMSRGAFTQSEQDKTLWIGPAFAYRVMPKLGVGAAVVYSHRSVRRQRNSTFETEDPSCAGQPGCPSTEITLDEELVRYTSGDLFARFGVRYDVTPELHLGLTVTTPSAHVRGSGTIIGIHSLTLIDPNTGQGTADYDPRENTGLEVANPQALEVRAGVAYGVTKKYTGMLDVSLHTAHDYDPVSLPDPNDPDTAIVSLLHIPTVERKTVVNVNVGGEYQAGRFPLRVGFFTNFSSAPTVVQAPENQLAHIDMYAVTASVGYLSQAGFELSFGVIYAFGSGDYAAWDPQAGIGGAYVPTSARRDSVYFYISGAKKFVKRVASKIVKSMKNDKNSGGGPDVQPNGPNEQEKP